MPTSRPLRQTARQDSFDPADVNVNCFGSRRLRTRRRLAPVAETSCIVHAIVRRPETIVAGVVMACR